MPDDGLYICAPDGPLLRSNRDALDLIGEAWGSGATWVAVPAERLHDDFFSLRTGVAGEIAQKFVNYRLGLAIVGDISRFTEVSSALRAWVLESNRGDHLWFVRDLDELAARRA
ncbi:DUF4180 domain-containing protein [Nonomuraea sp. SYSU D8015]|uniref:DUF4180 domain-containing protein n=1 Tax=Nonomuraea sp. SYSU D8015 TaxID=2593644 RepID=UPI001660455B|nr:DUF4180 domain-containing protein [Nonomuraea sp. SYSU D8015]